MYTYTKVNEKKKHKAEFVSLHYKFSAVSAIDGGDETQYCCEVHFQSNITGGASEMKMVAHCTKVSQTCQCIKGYLHCSLSCGNCYECSLL